MIKRFITYLASKPVILNLLRRILEANHRGEKRVIKEELTGHFSTVLDLGCGTGVFAPLFDSEYVGIDISPLYIAYASSTDTLSYVRADTAFANLTASSSDF